MLCCTSSRTSRPELVLTHSVTSTGLYAPTSLLPLGQLHSPHTASKDVSGNSTLFHHNTPCPPTNDVDHTENGRWHLAQRFIENKQKENIQEQIRVEADRAHRQIELERLAKLARADRYLQGFEPDLSEYAEQIARTQSLGGCSRIRQQPQPLAGLPLRIALGQVDLNRFGSSSVPTNGHGTDQSRYLMSMPDYMLHTRPWSLTGRSRKTLAEVIEARHQAHLEELRQQELARQELVRQQLVQQARSR